MARYIFCDVCEKEFDHGTWLGVSMQIPGFMVNQPEEAVYDVCSWDCIQKLVNTYRPVDDQVDFTTGPMRVTDPNEGPQIVNNVSYAGQTHGDEPEPAPGRHAEPDWEIPATGVYMPEGIRVDGKPAEALPRPTLRVKRD